MRKDLLILDADRQYALSRIKQLEDEIIALGPEFRDALTQTSESYHDNAPFEVVRDQQSMLAAEMANLKEVLRNSLPSIPRQKANAVGIGASVTITNIKTGKESSYIVAGDWTPRAGEKNDEKIVISCNSPLAQVLLGKKVGDEILFKSRFNITNIEYKLPK